MTPPVRRAPPVTTVLAATAALLSGCATVFGSGVSDPLTPEQSREQVVDAARDLVNTVQLQPASEIFYRSSCNDQNEAPFRGVVRISYPKAVSFEASDAEVAQMVTQLEAHGWTGDSDFKTHGSVVQKNKVVAVLEPQNVSTPNRGITLYGECRDMTSTKDDTRTEHISLG